MPDFHMRGATAADFHFARTLYMSSMEPLLAALDAWDAARAEMAFKDYFNVDEITIIALDNVDIGWLQVSCTVPEYCLDQIHLIEAMRNRGIGGQIIQDLLEQARSANRAVSLSLIKGNPSMRLYKRLGFKLAGEDETKYHMRCDPSALN